MRGNRAADQRLCFRYKDSTNLLLLNTRFQAFWSFSVTVQSDLVGNIEDRFSREAAQISRIQ